MLLDYNDQIDSFKYTDATTSQDSRVSNSKTLYIKRTLDITDLQVLRHFRTTLSILFLKPLLFLPVLSVLVIRPNKDVLVTRLISKALVEDWTSVFPLTPGQRVVSKSKNFRLELLFNKQICYYLVTKYIPAIMMADIARPTYRI